MAVTKTANTILLTAASDAVAGPLKITAMVHTGATTAGHVAQLNDKYDGSGAILFYSKSLVNAWNALTGQKVMTAPEGIKVATLTSGYIFLVVE